MGLKLKWFRRRLTFEGIPSAPERSTRRKEQNTGITVIGVYRQSTNYEDYIEPTRSSYSWEPASHPFVTTTIRKPPAAATSATSSTTTTLNSPLDKIAPAKTTNSRPDRETPPQPTYSPPKPPVRKSLTKTKSTPNIASASTFEPHLEVTRSVEVLNDDSVPLSRTTAAAAASRASQNVEVVLFNERSVDGDSLGSFRKVKSTARSPPPEVDSPLVVVTKRAEEKEVEEEEELWKQTQPEFFNEILQKVNGLAPKSPQLDRSKSKVEPSSWDDTESFDDIFQKVKARPRNPADGQESPQSHSIVEAFPAINRSPNPSIEDIFEPRTPELLPGEPKPRTSSPKPLKSILKKRAPAPPTSPQPQPQQTQKLEIPTPPPRSIRKEEPVPLKRTVSNDKIDDDDDDDYDTWNMVERHRSSITQTVARVNPEVMRNVPASLQVPRSQPQLQAEAPRTLRGMRDYHHKQPTANNNKNGDDDGGLFLGRHARGARDSESNQSEASA